VGDIYQGLLSSRRRGGASKSGRQRQQATLGAFYTPRGDVDYMVSRLDLRRDSLVLDPCMGSGHFLEGICEALLDRYAAEGYSREEAYREVVGRQLYGADIDTFATSLAAIRLFLLDESETREPPNLFVHDMLLHSPERPGTELFTNELLQAEGRERAAAERVVGADPAIEPLERIDEVEFTPWWATRPTARASPPTRSRSTPACTDAVPRSWPLAASARATPTPTRCSSRTGSSGCARVGGSA
jgi:hypothetical protein